MKNRKVALITFYLENNLVDINQVKFKIES
jgi:hypothetical protein